MNNIGSVGTEGREVAARFIAAIKNEDALAFWGQLDKKGQGLFLGMWYLSLESANISTIEALAGEESFLNNALNPIMANLKVFLGDLLETPALGEITVRDGNHALVPLRNSVEPGGEGRQTHIPLVLELAGGSASLTCWKVDTLRCINFTKNL